MSFDEKLFDIFIDGSLLIGQHSNI
jgi:hypothetical protein